MSVVWKKSSFSDISECVEATRDGKWILVRHSKFPSGVVFRFTLSEWNAFVAGVRNGEFDFEVLR